jgi:hypothetical protein
VAAKFYAIQNLIVYRGDDLAGLDGEEVQRKLGDESVDAVSRKYPVSARRVFVAYCGFRVTKDATQAGATSRVCRRVMSASCKMDNPKSYRAIGYVRTEKTAQLRSLFVHMKSGKLLDERFDSRCIHGACRCQATGGLYAGQSYNNVFARSRW